MTGEMTGVGEALVLAAEMTSETGGVTAALVATGAAGKSTLLTDTACSYCCCPGWDCVLGRV